MSLRGSRIQVWTTRVAIAGIFIGIMYLNIKVLSNHSHANSADDSSKSIVDEQVFSVRGEGRRTLKRSADTSVISRNVKNALAKNIAESEVNDKNISLKMEEANEDGSKLEPPMSKPRNCKQAHCIEFLKRSERIAMMKCSTETAKRTINGRLQGTPVESKLKENDCNFINGTNRLPVALASTSGSGNTWIRGLLERATGICTGFIYCDYAMRREGFVGESVKSGSALVVKTHTVDPKWHGTKQQHSDDPYYGAAIYIVRNPFKSMIAEWNRKVTYDILRLPHKESHTNIIQEKYWRIPDWDEFLRSYMVRWQSRLKSWVLDSKRESVHVVQYEDLQRDIPGEVGKMLNFLKIPFNTSKLSQTLRNDFTAFKRKHTNDDFDHYSSVQTDYVRSILLDTIKLTQDANMSDILHISEYLP